MQPSSDTDLERRELRQGRHPGDRYARVVPNVHLERLGPGHLSVTSRAAEPRSAMGKLRYLLIGPPIATAQEIHERLTKLKALAIFGSDNISSSAYATEEIMRVLVLAGAGALALTLPLTLAVILMLAVVVISYQQTIRAYPKGASAYLVASGELGRRPGLIAAASLLTDYILTVSVSIASGVAALGSWEPFFYDHRVLVSVALIALMTIGNLRGVRESGTIFAIPTYVYVLSMFGLLAYGALRALTGTLPHYSPPPAWTAHWSEQGGGAIGLFLILRAFASGAVGLTGTEAISDGVPAFKPPEWKNARITLVWMASTFAVLFLGVSFLSGHLGVVPDPSEQQTVPSLVARALVGTGWYFVLVQFATALVLTLAANTAFSDFPRLSYFLARDGFMPHQFSHRGDRLAFSAGIVTLAAVASVLLILFGGSVNALIPLYTIGVFFAFTLSQTGMVAHWKRNRGSGWRWKAAINGVGATVTGVVAVIVAVTKFQSGESLFSIAGLNVRAGSWMVLVLVPLVIAVMLAIRKHYTRATEELRVERVPEPGEIRHRIVVPVAALNRAAVRSLTYARSLSPNVTALHVAETPEEGVSFRKEWEGRYQHLGDLVIIDSPYRFVVGPILAYVDAVREKDPDAMVTVVLPEFVPRHWWEGLLHNQTALRLKAALLFRPNTVVTDVPYHLRE